MSVLDRILGGREDEARVALAIDEQAGVARITGNAAGLHHLQSMIDEARRRGVAAGRLRHQRGEIIVRQED
jgi:hypothetical protein